MNKVWVTYLRLALAIMVFSGAAYASSEEPELKLSRLGIDDDKSGVHNANLAAFQCEQVNANFNFPKLGRDLQEHIILNYLDPKTAKNFYQTCRAGKVYVMKRYEKNGRFCLKAFISNPKNFDHEYITQKEIYDYLKLNLSFEHCQHFSLIDMQYIHMDILQEMFAKGSKFNLLQLLNPSHLSSISLQANRFTSFEIKRAECFSALPQFVNLRHLELMHVLELAQCMRHIAQLTQLETLSMRNARLEKPEVFAPLAALTNLRSLDLSGNKPRDALAHLSHLTSLRSLVLYNCCLGEGLEDRAEDEALHFDRQRFAPLKTLSSLNHLNISGNRLKNHIAFASQFLELRSLDISGNLGIPKRYNASIQSLRFLEGLPLLEELICKDNYLASLPKQDGLAVLSKLSLRKLDLSGCNMIESKTAAYLTGLTSLHILNIAGRNVAPEACQNLIEEGVAELAKLTQLRELDLSRNGLGENSQEVSALKTMTQLRYLNLKDNNFKVQPDLGDLHVRTQIEIDPIKPPVVESFDYYSFKGGRW